MIIDKVELQFVSVDDYRRLREIMIESYKMEDFYWEEEQLERLIEVFPEGQVSVVVNDEVVGCALSIVVDYNQIEEDHTYDHIVGNYSFETHNPKGDALYGIEIFVKPEYRGLRLGRRLYDFRKELCEQLNLRCIVFGGRMPNYHKFAKSLSPREYIEKIKLKEIDDPVLNFQLSNGFHVKKVLSNYLPGDEFSKEYAVLLQWDNIYYTKPKKKPHTEKSVVRLGLVQWQMRPYKTLDELLEQIDFFVDAVSDYRCDFALFPEFFNAPLMAAYNHMSTADSIRELAKFSAPLKERFVSMAISYNINIIAGSMPEIIDDRLYNVGYLCKRNGDCEPYVKLHVTPDERTAWGLSGGDKLKVFNTDCGKIGILICYDVEFPELSRILADQGMNILFIPFLTDTQNGYSRVRHCAQARAIENECYVAIAGSVGNLPKVHNMDMQFAQSVVFTPCDFSFPTNGIKAEATPNTEMVLVADIDLDLLKELHQFGSVTNLKDRRRDIYDVRLKTKQNKAPTHSNNQVEQL